MPTPLRVAVIGVGHMGRHHARLYGELSDCRLVAVVDKDRAKAEQIAAQHGGTPYAHWLEVAEPFDAATVAVPTVHHAEVAIPLLERGVAVLVEKPLASDTGSARQILDAARRSGTPLQVGHSERFNPVVQAMLRMEVAPRFIETHRISPFTFRSADIGVVFDMMIHDIDIALHLVNQSDEATKRRSDEGETSKSRKVEKSKRKSKIENDRPTNLNPPYALDVVGVNVLGPHEDVANARVRFPGGIIANMTASRLALKTERKIRVFCPTAYFSMDYQKKTGIAIKLKDNIDLIRFARERNFEDLSQMASLDFSSMVKIEPLTVEEKEPLRAEIESFLEAVRHGTAPAVSAEEGYAAVEMAERITQAVREQDLGRHLAE